MSLLVVRHGQASAGSDDYDCLSARGELQCTRLGHWLAATGHQFDAVVIGNMRRHRQSYEAIAAVYAELGLPLPAPEADAGLDEFDHHAVFDGFSRAHPQHASVLASSKDGLKALGAMIHAALSAWSEDRIADVPESWEAFGARVSQASQRLSARGEQNVLVLTSGGVISRLAQAVLGATDRSAVDLNLSLRNSAFCEFHSRPYGLALGCWNALPHLHDQRELWTYY